ncbi:Fumarate reductase flavoprotein subunit [Dickeya aquatica]|uniref:Fumarate reductase flavoprotein subunit n=2 Tax=Pectobacteriaceae TaxID=1903410 RepID=A0A375A7Q2_9GAMM|nr:Fumarate reductase flavoprotein subunit [Dickeya aquatica]
MATLCCRPLPERQRNLFCSSTVLFIKHFINQQRNRVMKRSSITLLTGLLIAACTLSVAQAESFKAGTYSSSKQGIGGDVTVTIEVDASGTVNKASIDAPSETPEVGGEAAKELAKTMTEKKTINVDGVSGATMTSGAVHDAAQEAYAKARQ